MTPAQMLLIEEAAKKAAIVQTVGNYVLSRESLLTETKDGMALLPFVLQHDQLQSSLAKILTTLGLERQAKHADIAERLAAMHATPSAAP